MRCHQHMAQLQLMRLLSVTTEKAFKLISLIDDIEGPGTCENSDSRHLKYCNVVVMNVP